MESAFRFIGIRLLFACLMIALLGGVVWAQGTGEITGLVTDPSGAVISGATVTLTNSATGEKRTTVTTSAGVYTFPALPVVGSYTVQVSPKGFKSVKVVGVVVSVGTTVTKDLKLELGAATEQVTVEAGAEVVQTTDSSLSTLVDRRMWQNAPLENRSQNTFINQAPGAVPDMTGEGNTRGAAVNGARGGTGNYLVDGMDNNEQGQGGRGQLGFDPGGASTSISPDAIQEYRLITNSFNAEYGKAGGFVTDTVLRSGTNSWHGSLYEYNRVQALAAQHYFSHEFWQGPGFNKDSLVRNMFGGSFGGPVVKNKSFFFFTIELNRLREAAPISATSTTQQYLDFVNNGGLQQWAESDPSGLCNNQTFLDNYFGDGSLGSGGTAAPCTGAFATTSGVGSGTLGPIFNKLSSTQPFPLATNANTFQSDGQGLYTAGLTYPVPVYGTVQLADPTHLNETRITGKYDHNFGADDKVSVLYLLQSTNSGSPYDCGNATIGPACITDGRGQTAGVTWNHTFTPTLLNSFRVGFLRHRLDFGAPASAVGIPGIATWSDPLGVSFGMYAGIPQYFTENQFQYQDSLTLTHGKHTFKAGAEYRRTRNGSSFFNDTYGSFFPWGVEDLTTDLAFTDQADLALASLCNPASEFCRNPQTGQFPANGSVAYTSAAINPTNNQLPDPYRGYRANEFAAYFQDDWRILPRLTLNLGLRWEYFGPPHNFKPNIDSNFYFGTPITPFEQTCLDEASGNYVPCTSLDITPNPFFPGNSGFYSGVSTATFQVRNHEIWNKDTNNFGPRLGFSWDVFGTQKFVVRAGSGIMYDRIFNNVFENIRFNPPYFADNQIGILAQGTPVGALSLPGIYTVPFTSTTMYGAGAHALPNPRHMDQNTVTPYYEQFHFGTQWEFLKGYVLETNYVGTFGHKLMGFRDINTFNGRVAAGQVTTRPSTVIGADNFRSNSYASNYHSLQATVRKTFSNGLSFNANYAYSKAMDDMSDVFNNRSAARPTDNMNPKADYGPADFDLKHRFVANVSYDLPFMKNNRWLGGWAINSIVEVQGGAPFSPYSSSSSYDLNKDGYNTDRIVYIGKGKPQDSVSGKTSPAFGYYTKADWAGGSRAARYKCPASVNGGLWCDAPIGRNSITGPGYTNVDLGITKSFKVTERVNLKLQGNFFNIFNHPNFQPPVANDTSASWTKSVATYDPRISQLVLRLDF